MDSYTYTTLREVCKRSGGLDVPTDDPDQFYRAAFADAVAEGSGQLHNEREWERARRPYYTSGRPLSRCLPG